MNERRELGIGSEIGGYRIEAEAGRGGMGVVYRATQLELDRTVALKLIAPELADDPSFRERFKRESRIAASIDDPNVIPVYEAGEVDGLLFITMSFVEGKDLRALLREERRLPPHRAAAIVSQVADALDAAHARGLVHRDIKPGNILLTRRGGRDHAYLTDFGLTKHTGGGAGLTKTGTWVGTLDYVAPEQIQGGAVDARTDVYALGCVLYQCLTGRIPYEKDSDVAKIYAHMSEPPPPIRQVVPAVPEELAGVVDRAMAKDPDERFLSAGDFGRAAVAAAEGRAAPAAERPVGTGEAAPGQATHLAPTPPAPPPPPTAVGAPEAASSRRRGNRPLILAGTLAAAAVLALAVVALVGGGGDDEEAQNEAGRVVATVPVGEEPFEVELGPDGTVWVSNRTEGTLSRIDPDVNEVVEKIKVGGTPTNTAPTADAVWVANYDGGITRVDPATNEMVEVVRLEGSASFVAAGEAGVWTADTDDDTVTRIDPLTNEPAATVDVGDAPAAVAVQAGAVWVVNSGDDNVMRIDPLTEEVGGDPIPVGESPFGIEVDDGTLYVGNGDGSVSIIDASTGRPDDDPIDVGGQAFGIDVAGGEVWISEGNADRVRRLDAETEDQVGDTIRVGEDPGDVAVSDDAVWVVNGGDRTLSRIEP